VSVGHRKGITGTRHFEGQSGRGPYVRVGQQNYTGEQSARFLQALKASDWQGAVNKQEEEEEEEEELLGHNTVLVFVVFQRRCYRRRLDPPGGQSDLSPIHSDSNC
ncbi:hypothetical protein IRJ41_016088, partial [Triplophysa rosa]